MAPLSRDVAPDIIDFIYVLRPDHLLLMLAL
jgi:hypothetical protein